MPDDDLVCRGEDDSTRFTRTNMRRTKRPHIVKIVSAHYLTIEGRGVPGGPEFEKLVGALYAAA